MIRLIFIGISILTILLGIFQIKRKDTDPVLSFCGCMAISCGFLLLVSLIFAWNQIV